MHVTHSNQCDCYLYTLFATFAHLSLYENMFVHRQKCLFHTGLKKMRRQPKASVFPYPYHTLGPLKISVYYTILVYYIISLLNVTWKG